MKHQTFYRTITLNGVDIFYRESGDREMPVLLLLHGFPSSSHMFRNLITELSGSFYIIAPDYPGFGQSSAPGVNDFNYTFDNLSVIIEQLIDQLALSDIIVYMQDYGGPVGMRIATRRPRLFSKLIVQNANAYEEGLGPTLEPLTRYASNPDKKNEAEVRFFLSLEATRWQYLNGASQTEAIDPDSYITDQYYLDRPGNAEIQLALFRDYANNFSRYPEWQQYFRSQQPPTLVIWGDKDAMFVKAGGAAYHNDLPEVSIVFLNGGHCVLEEHNSQIARLILDFNNG